VAKVYVNGSLVEEDEASVSVFDHGLVVGDGVFETILLHRGRPFALRRHLDRLARSASGLGISSPPRAVIEHAVRTTVEASGQASGRVRVTLTAGRGPLGSGRLGEAPTLVVAIGELGEVHEIAAVATVPYRRNEFSAVAGLKTTSYAENALALAKAEELDADEAIFANTAGMLCEGTGSNVFVVLDGEVLTPPLSSGCLAGITRDLVLESGIGREADVSIGDFNAERLDEAFLTSSIRGVQPIGAIDGAAMQAAPGPISAKAAELYNTLLEKNAEP
jgi:branched-chain amino acid aminotransferase